MFNHLLHNHVKIQVEGDFVNVGFIYNPESGSGHIVKYLDYIKSTFLQYNHSLELLPTKKSKDAEIFASQSKHDMLLIAGGDGTINEVVNGLMKNQHKPTLALIPTGTVNDVGSILGIPKNIKKALKLILNNPVIRAVDITKINNRYFIYAAATGKFAKASYDIRRTYKRRYGAISYFFRGSKDLFQSYNIPVEITYDNGKWRGVCSIILLLNGARVAGISLNRMKSKMNDGVIEARFFKNEPGVLFRVFGFFVSGGLYDTKKNKTIRSSKFTIDMPDTFEWNTDGEYAFKGPVEVKVIQQAIHVVVHPKRLKRHFE